LRRCLGSILTDASRWDADAETRKPLRGRVGCDQSAMRLSPPPCWKSTLPPRRRKPSTAAKTEAPKVGSAVTLRRAPGGKGWEFLPPKCATQRQDDLDEVHKMLELGEIDVAIDELRWLLEECADFVDAHRLLGELALTNGDLPLARGHFGYAYTASTRALPSQLEGPVLYETAGNRSFFESAKGLAHCLIEMEKPDLARDVLDKMLELDPADPLSISAIRDGLPPKARGK